MPLQIVRNDITKMKVDAIVNASDKKLSGGGGIDKTIHRAAGKELTVECRKLGTIETGEAVITEAYALPCKYVIHTAGPRWRGGDKGEREQLEACFTNSLKLAEKHGCESVAFPLISAGVYKYPKDQAIRVAVDAISSFLTESDMTVYLVIFGKAAFKISEKLFSGIQSFIDDNYVDEHTDLRREMRRMAPCGSLNKRVTTYHSTTDDSCTASASMDELDQLISEIDESFTQMLLRKIDESGMTDSQCYKKANIDRKLFSKIRGDINYRPSKVTAIAFAIALELSLDETRELLKKAGFALSRSNKFDIIIEFFITNGIYDVYRINEALFAFDQVLLGA